MNAPVPLTLEEKRNRALQILREKQARNGIARRRGSGPPPLSYAQQRLWFLHRLVPDSPFYNLPAAIRLKIPLDAAVLRAVLNEILRRHESLRTAIHEIDAKPVQKILPAAEVPFFEKNLEHLPSEQRERAAFEAAAEDARMPFDLARGPLIRAGLLRLGPQDHVFLLNLHHIAADGWSMGVLVREFEELYLAFSGGKPSPLPDLPIQYADFAAWQREMLESGGFQAQLNFWTRQLAALPTLELPCDFARREVQGFDGETLHFALPLRLVEELKRFAREQSATLFQVLFAAFNALLHRYTGQDEIVIGEPVANRNRVELEPMIGFFVNSLVLRTDLSGDPTFSELLQRSRSVVLDADANQDVPFEVLVERLNPERSMGRNPLFQVSLQFFSGAERSMDARVPAEMIHVEKGTASLDLAWDLVLSDEGILARVEYSTELFRRPSIERMFRHYENLLHAFLANPQVRISRAQMLADDEIRGLIHWSGASAQKVSCEDIHPLVPGMFKTAADRNPDCIAIECGERRISYRDLNVAADRFAALLEKKQFGPEQIAAVYLERSIEYVTAVLAVWKTGGAILPIEPNTPRDRLEFTLRDARPRVILTNAKHSSRFSDFDGSVIACDCLRDDTSAGMAAGQKGGPENLAYVIYTSGSSGQPKGVMVEHGALARHLLWMLAEFPLGPEDRTLAKYSITFDVSILEVCYPLLAGARLTIVPDEGPVDMARLARLMNARGTTVLDVVPSALPALLDCPSFGAGASLRRIFCGGEVLTPELLRRLRERTSAEIINIYGPTEATISSIFWRAGEELPLESVPIGRPGAGYSAFVLDHSMNLLPAGIPGELYLGGDCLARGYLNRPELTRERFVPDPFSGRPLARLYRTGDRCCWSLDGNLKFLGRMDEQVKLRGYRIELPEVEAALQSIPLVRKAAAAVTGEHGQERLTAYIVPNTGAPELWPSVGEYFIYDELLYQAMARDRVRLNAYRSAIEKSVRGKIVADLGTGADLVMARLCLEAGARKVYAVEMLEDAFQRACRCGAELRAGNRLQIIHSDIRTVQLPEPVDVCVSELIGTIASSEGVIDLLNDARRLLRPGGQMIPVRAVTKVAAVRLPANLADRPQFGEIPGYYARRIFERLGRPFDLRVCIKNLPAECVVSTVDTFEDLHFGEIIPRESSAEFRLKILQAGRVDGLLLWIQLFTSPDDLIDIRAAESTWLPLFLPLFSPPADFAAGDAITAAASRIAEPDSFTPSYLIRATAVRAGRAPESFTYETRCDAQAHRSCPFYEALHDLLNSEPEQPGRAAEPENSRVNDWKAIYEEIYRSDNRSREASFDVIGWNSSYTGQPLSRMEMHEQVHSTLQRLQPLAPRDVLEVGCGTGLLLLELAGSARRYVGTDFSGAVISQVAREVSARGWKHVELYECAADNLEKVSGPFDLIVLNSIIQYFPGMSYLLRVLDQCIAKLAPGGFLFIGDVRSLPLLPLLHAEIEYHQAGAKAGAGEFLQRLEKRGAQEQELVIDPEFFGAYAGKHDLLSGACVSLKRGTHLNELTRFRYDVLIQAGSKPAPPDGIRETQWDAEQTVQNVREMLIRDANTALLIRNVPNARVASSWRWLEGVWNSLLETPVSELLPPAEAHGVDPEQFWSLEKDLPWRIHIILPAAQPHCYDVLCCPENSAISAITAAAPKHGRPVKPWAAYANSPQPKPGHQFLTQKIREQLRERLPEYMVPSTFVCLDSLPLTPSGKLNRRALPAPDRSPQMHAAITPAETDLQRKLLEVWKEVLAVERLGIESHFFNSGGHSLMAMQVTSRLSSALGFEVPLRLMFERPTIRELAEALTRMSESAAPQTIPPLVPAEAVVPDIDNLSEDEVNEMLRKLLDKTPAMPV